MDKRESVQWFVMRGLHTEAGMRMPSVVIKGPVRLGVGS